MVKVQLVQRKYTFKHWNNYDATLRVGRGKELSLVDLQMIFLHRQDQSIEFSRKFYWSSSFLLYFEASLGSLLGLLQSSASGVVL